MQKMLRTIFFLILFFHLISCQENTNPCLLSNDILKDIQTLDSLTKCNEIRQRDIMWMKKNYNEPSLLDSKIETYRFIWSNSFDTIRIDRIEKHDRHFKVTKKIFANNHDTIGITSKFEVLEGDWNNIVSRLEKNNFWTYPTSDNRSGLHGTTWILEGYKPVKDKCTLKNYHRVGRWSPIDTTFISMCDLLYKLKKK